MNIRKLSKIICAGIISGTFLFGSVSEAGVVTDRMPLQCYADHQINTYNSPGAAKRAGYISANVDLIRITQVRGDGWCYGSYPGAGGRRVSRWFKITDVYADAGYTNRSVNVRGKQTVYRTHSGGATLGSVSNNEGVIVVADNGSRAQIVYRLDNGMGYKLGWILSSSVPPVPQDVKKGDINGDGVVNRKDLELLQQYRQKGKYTAVGDFDENGQLTLADFSSLLQIVNENEDNATNIPANLQNLINKWNNTIWRNHTYLSNVKECKEFASFIFDQMYHVGYIGGGSTSSNAKNYLINLSNPSKVGLRGYRINISAASAQDLFRSAKAGDFVQIRRRNGGPHSGIFVNRTANGIILFEANADGKNSIRTNSYTYSALASRNYAMSLYYAK